MATDQLDDPLFADDAVFPEETPADVARNHAEYLYGDKTWFILTLVPHSCLFHFGGKNGRVIKTYNSKS